MPAPLEPIEPTAGDTETSTRAIIFTSSSSIHLIILIVSFIYFDYVFPYHSSTWNPMLLLWYILGLVVLLVIIFNVLSWSNTTLSFLHTLGIILFLFLYSYPLLFLKHVVSPNLLELHITQEAPLPPCNFNRSYHIEDNAQLGWGEIVEEGSFYY